MLVLYLITIVSTVEGGLFNLASRHRDNEPLWQQVKALQRINFFLKDVQQEIKESRDLLKQINFKNIISNQSITDLRHDKKPSVIPKSHPNRYFSMVMPDMLKKDPATTSSTTLSTTPEITTLPTLFIRQGPEIHATVIPDIESDYGDMLPYFRHEGRHRHRHSKVNKKKNSNKKYQQHVNNSKPISKRKAGILLKAPSYRPIMAVDEYVKLQNDIDETTAYDDENHRHLIRENLESYTAYMTETIYYNKYKNFGQKRFNIVTQKLDHNSQNHSQKRSTRRTTNLPEIKLVKRPSVNFKNSDAVIHIIDKRTELDPKHTPAKSTRRPKNKHLRNIIDSSSYSDEETALIVNLMDQFYHYNNTNKQNTENKVL